MGSRLVNVRLDEARQRKARTLRENGVTLSDVVRDAIDDRFEALCAPKKHRGMRRLVAEIFEKYPDAANVPQRSYDVHDRQQAAQAIRRSLGRRRR